MATPAIVAIDDSTKKISSVLTPQIMTKVVKAKQFIIKWMYFNTNWVLFSMVWLFLAKLRTNLDTINLNKITKTIKRNLEFNNKVKQGMIKGKSEMLRDTDQ